MAVYHRQELSAQLAGGSRVAPDCDQAWACSTADDDLAGAENSVSALLRHYDSLGQSSWTTLLATSTKSLLARSATPPMG